VGSLPSNRRIFKKKRKKQREKNEEKKKKKEEGLKIKRGETSYKEAPFFKMRKEKRG
jgi:hypothetical protein